MHYFIIKKERLKKAQKKLRIWVIVLFTLDTESLLKIECGVAQNENVHGMPRLRVQVIESRQRLNNRNILPEMRSKNDDRNQGRQNYHSKDDNRKSIKLSDGQMIKNWVYESKGIYFRGLKIQHSILFLYFDSS